MPAPNPHALAAMALIVAMFYGFASGRARVEIVSLLTISAIALGLYSFPLPGQAPTDGLKLAFESFGHYALVTICALMVLGRGLVVTGALEPAARFLAGIWRINGQLGLLVALLMAMGLSMMVNDTPVIVLMLPVMTAIAASGGTAASKTLIPINSAVLIGGMATTIGTSTNLLVVSIATDLGMPPMSVFHFTPIVLAAAAIAFPFIWLVMPRLLPDNSVTAGHQARLFTATLRLRGELTDQHRRTIAERLPALTMAGASDTDRVVVRGTQHDIEEAARILNASPVPLWLMDRLKRVYGATGEDLAVVEMSVPRESNLARKSVAQANFAAIHEVGLVGIHDTRDVSNRDRVTHARPQSEVVFGEGDIILATGTIPNLQEFARAENLLLLEGARELPRTAKAPLALAIMAAAVIPASIGIVPIAISSLAGAIAMLVTGCVKFDRIGRALSAQVIVLVAASIAIGRVMLETGAADWLGGVLALGLGLLPAAGVVAAVMLFVTVLTNFASNTTAAAVGTPIAFSIAQKLGLPVEPLVLAVLFGCNLCYATPVAYQTNMLIMNAGDYRFGDYTRTGIPLVAIMIVALSWILASRYGLF